jgi:ABC-type transport system involved in cytochrome bd biosynthesis fused ATPase/permease subunit
LRLTFAGVLLALGEVLELDEATGTSDNRTGLAVLVLVARVSAKDRGSLLTTTSVNISGMGDEIQKGRNHLEEVLDLCGLQRPELSDDRGYMCS